jgi:hypothetical protein
MSKNVTSENENQIFESVLNTINSLNLPHSFELDFLVKRISEVVNQEIEFMPCNMSNGTTGVVISGETIHIFYEANISPIHQIQIKLHELGHAILGHLNENDQVSNEDAILKSFYTSINKYDSAQSITMKRQIYDAKSEKEAELFATELIARVKLDAYTSDDPIYSVSFQ